MATLAAVPPQDFQSLVLSCNKDGMESLRLGQTKAAFEQFKYAESVLIAKQAEGDFTSLLAVTCNNLGCYYKKVGKLHGALSYLRRALQMEVDLGTDEVTVAGTHLNICAILSKLEKHDKAVQHALCALELINRRVESSEPDKVAQDDYSVLAIAYHNVAVERDYLQQYDKAAAAFEQGHQVAKRFLGQDHPLALALGKNCDAVLQKSKKLGRPSGPLSTQRSVMKDADLFKLTDGLGATGPTSTVPASSSSLPAVPGAAPRAVEADAPMPTSRLRQDAAQWADSESAAWSSFAQSALTGAPPPSASYGVDEAAATQLRLAPAAAEDLAGLSRTAPLQAITLKEARAVDLDMPSLSKEAATLSSTAPLVPRPPPKRKKADDGEEASMSVLAKVSSMDGAPRDALMDLVDADRTGYPVANPRQASHDYRPNRQIKGSTRTARVVRRTGLHNSTHHRDDVISGGAKTQMSQVKSEYVRRMAAERIQRTWRAWYKYCNEHSEWISTTWVCATIIQANWRSYRVRRKRKDNKASEIQRHARGFLVRRSLRRHKAAVTIQRHIVGVLTRSQLCRMGRASVKVQSLIRGFLDRRRVAKKRAFMTKIALRIQCGVRMMIAKRRTKALREAKREREAQKKAATDIQRSYRGLLGRRRFIERKAKYLRDQEEYKAASKLQAMARRDAAIKRVDVIRMEKLERMDKAATFLRKMWLGQKTRKKYMELLKEFAAHERHVITMQRHARGFLVRLRMWREAVRMEEELWAALEIQRTWRGYLGRVKWEGKYEEVWRRETSAAMIQRSIRGWLARARVRRAKRRIARAEFERARLRFRSAQRIQALARGVVARRRTSAVASQKRKATTRIQSVIRGHLLRKKLWAQVVQLRATIIQAHARGFLVRNRRFHLVAKVICIQRCWRRARRRPAEVKDRANAERKTRMENAAKIQKAFKSKKEQEEVARIQQQ